MIGGGYLCFEGFEKVFHHLFHSGEKNKQARLEKLKALMDETINLVKLEKEKIKGAIRTDFVLSAEIIVIALGTVKDETFLLQATVVASIAILMTVGVYGLVAAIVKLDDLGFHLVKEEKFNASTKTWRNNFMVCALPYENTFGCRNRSYVFSWRKHFVAWHSSLTRAYS